MLFKDLGPEFQLPQVFNIKIVCCRRPPPPPPTPLRVGYKGGEIAYYQHPDVNSTFSF